MVYILPTGQSLLVRTDFTDDTAWRTLRDESQSVHVVDGVQAQATLTVVDDLELDGISPEELYELAGDELTYMFVADARTFSDDRRSILVVDLHVSEDDGESYSADDEDDGWPGSGGASSSPDSVQTFRVTPDYLAVVENNLSIGNMDFGEFVALADAQGVVSGSPAVSETRTLVVENLLAASGGSDLPQALVNGYVEALRSYRPATVAAKYKQGLGATYEYLVENREALLGAREVQGIELTLQIAARDHGPVLGFFFAVKGEAWSANVDVDTLVPVTLYMTRRR